MATAMPRLMVSVEVEPPYSHRALKEKLAVIEREIQQLPERMVSALMLVLHEREKRFLFP